MFERYTDRARRALFFARYETSHFGSHAIETEHLLLGVLRDVVGLTGRLLARANLSYADALSEVKARVTGRDWMATSVEIPFSAQTTGVLLHAAKEAERLRHDYIGTEHLLLGLLREEGTLAFSILQAHGLQADAVRDELVNLLGEGNAEGTEPAEVEASAYTIGFGAESVDVFESYQSRVLQEGVHRIQELLAQLAVVIEGNPHAIELIDAIHVELASLKPPGAG